jgi:predicted lipoprotein
MKRAIIATLCILVAGLGAFATYRKPGRSDAKSVSRHAVLEQCIIRIVRPSFERLADAANALRDAARELSVDSNPATLRACQQQWIELHRAWKEAQIFSGGGVLEQTVSTEISYWPAYALTVENVVRSPRPLDPAFFEVLGAGAKGFYALEYLLFDLPGGNTGRIGDESPKKPRLSATMLLSDPTAERRRTYARGLAEHLAARCEVLRDAARKATLHAQAAGQEQDAINQLVNQMVETIETMTVARLSKHLEQLDLKRLTYESVEGLASGTSVAALAAPLQATEALYLGGDAAGFDDLARCLNPDLDERLRAQFKRAIASVTAIELPLDDALLRDRAKVEQALSDCRALEILCKVDLASSLGVTITFGSADGD